MTREETQKVPQGRLKNPYIHHAVLRGKLCLKIAGWSTDIMPAIKDKND